MKKLILSESEQTALQEAWLVDLPDESVVAKLNEVKIMRSGTREQRAKFDQLMQMKFESEQKKWRQWLIDSGIIKWLVLCEADKGLKGLGMRIRAEWGQLVDEYDLKEQFNQAYTDVISEYQ